MLFDLKKKKRYLLIVVLYCKFSLTLYYFHYKITILYYIEIKNVCSMFFGGIHSLPCCILLLYTRNILKLIKAKDLS